MNNVHDSSKRAIVAFAAHPWVEPEWMNRQQILSRLGQRGWRVAYSFGALDWWQRSTVRWSSSPLFNRSHRRDGIVDVEPGRLGARWQKISLFDEFRLGRHARFVRRQVARDDEKPIAMLFDPQFFPYIRHLEPCDVVYHAYDDFSGQMGWTEEKAAMQKKLLSRANMVSASSEMIAQSLNYPGVRVLENGADVDAFFRAVDRQEPADLVDIPHPRIGYVGALNRKVDFPMIAAIARDRPAWHWVLVGRIEERELESEPEVAVAFRACRAMKNVHFLGQKHRLETPRYVGHMDINTMCYRHGGKGWWNAVSPLKLHEYLSSGQPVVSAPVPAVRKYADVLEIAGSPEEWLECLSRLLLTPDTRAAERVQVALQNSWDKRVDVYEEWLLAMDRAAFSGTVSGASAT
jgi:glycosyltransferase involved in cell wall biosynthesis